MTTQYIAYTVKGLEEIAADEIQEVISDAVIHTVAEKRVIFSADCSFKQLGKLKAVDDIQFLLHSFPKPASVNELVQELKFINFQKAWDIIASFRKIEIQTFSITYGAVKTTEYASVDLLTQIKTAIENTYHWQYFEKDHSNFDIRIFMDEITCYISARITKESLHHRKYKQFEKPGSLRPSIAAAMVRLVTQKNMKGKLVDNFCGSGTILCEARSKDMDVYGGDIDPQSVLYTQKNLANIKNINSSHLKVLDATKTNWPANTFDYALSNLPYGKQIPLSHITTLYEQTLQEYIRITKPTGRICLLLTNPDLMEKYIKIHIPKANVIKYQLGFTGQTPTIILIQMSGIIHP